MRLEEIHLRICDAVEDVTGVSIEAIQSRSRDPIICYARALFMWVAYQFVPASARVAKWVGRDGSTVRHAVRVIEANGDIGGITKGWKKQMQERAKEWMAEAK